MAEKRRCRSRRVQGHSSSVSVASSSLSVSSSDAAFSVLPICLISSSLACSLSSARPTNYRKPGHAKAITNGVNQVIEDIQRLRNVEGSNLRRLILFAFYPIYSESYNTFNSLHLQRISQELGKLVKSPKIRIKIGSADFNLYAEEF
jgi:hypothetical protein